VYRFLCSLQRQGVASDLTWDWGPLGQAPFLPRVVAGRVVLARARWRLAEEDLTPLRSKDAVEQFAAVQRTRARRRLPRYVALADGDNELVIDLDNVLCVEALVDQVKSRTTAVLVELFPRPSELCVSGPEGAFVHEVAIPFVRGAAPVGPAVEDHRPASTNRRRFPPGSEWLYLKLYGGTAGADEVLDVAGSALDAYVTTGAADSWFFIRYSDPDPHLRLRVHGTGDALHAAVGPGLQALAASLVDSGHLWRVQLDTYEREVERYGGEQAVELAEAVFFADSRAALAAVRRLPGDEGADLRWRVALRGVDLLFDDLGLTPEEKRMLARAARDGYRREFSVGRQFHANVSHRFRSERAALEELLDPAHEHAGPLRSLSAAFAIRSASIADVGDALRALARRKALTSSLLDVAMSHAHMHVNRVLRSAHRAQELVLYEFLDRLYTAAAARSDAP
jgi:thiopeptide-type bacteriocin biosynthesis protein